MVSGISNLNINKIYWMRTDFALIVESINPSDLPKCKYFSHYTPINKPQVYKRYPPVDIKTDSDAEKSCSPEGLARSGCSCHSIRHAFCSEV